ncbi:MAG: alcohol dehydrogenase catalytic domain-containing protein, partial [Planctomycetota bacterium]|nr:alcohol dehydrogenase catalytic domain-containing protein [Planctomycetota bacterium]
MSETETTMQALVLHAVGDLRVERVPRKQPRAGEVLVRVAFCGVCGSDLPRLFIRGTYRFPTVCGHELAGTVAECGEGVTGLPLGEKVTLFPLLWCGHCAACEHGHYARCINYDYLGSRSDGGFAEYVVAPRRNILPLPPNVSPE